MRTKLVIAAGALVATLGFGATPAAAAGRVDSSVGLTTRSPGSPTGLVMHAFFRRRDDPKAKPPPLRSAVIHAPSGLRFDTRAVEQCTASDEELRALGPSACPTESELTVGSFSGITGFGPPLDPVAGDNHVFNGPDQLIEVITSKGTPRTLAIDRLTISGSTLTAHPPMAPGGPPEGESAVRSLDFRIPVRTAGGRSLITTPPDCPPSGQWTSTARFGFADGSTDTATASNPCTSGGRAVERGSQRPRLRLAVHPRRVRAGRRYRLRVRVRSSARRCVRGARLLLGSRRFRPDRRGRAVLGVRFGRTGARRVRATAPGCRPASASVRVSRSRARRR